MLKSRFGWPGFAPNPMPDLKIKYDLQKINKDNLTSVLIGLWGRKLGSERSKEEYYIPEIYRAGLGFKLKAGARPRVLALSRKVRK